MTTKQPGHNDQMVATSPSATHRQGLLPFVICAVAAVATLSVFVLPILVFGPPEYTTADWRRALVWGIVAGTVGPAVQALVSRLHEREQHQAELASSLQDALTEVTL